MNYAIWHLFGPSTWPFWLVMLAVVAQLRGSVRLRARVLYLAAIIIVVTGILPTGYWLMQQLESSFSRADLPTKITDIVVLAGGENLAASDAAGTLELNRHGDRVSEAVALAESSPAAQIWIVGGVGHGLAKRDIDLVEDYWMRAGINPQRIHKIGGTRDTCENAAGIAKALPGARVVLITSGFHMPRAMACMKAAGVDAIAYPVDRQTWRLTKWHDAFSAGFIENMQRTDLALHEYVGLAYYRLTGRIKSL